MLILILSLGGLLIVALFSVFLRSLNITGEFLTMPFYSIDLTLDMAENYALTPLVFLAAGLLADD